MNKIIQAKEATITETTIDVQVIRIGRKQMTLSVFRQLPEWDEDLWVFWDDDDNTVLYNCDIEIWGYVNYCPGKCKDGSEHLHIILKDESDVLYRTNIYQIKHRSKNIYKAKGGKEYGYRPRGEGWVSLGDEWEDENANRSRFYNYIKKNLTQLFIAV